MRNPPTNAPTSARGMDSLLSSRSISNKLAGVSTSAANAMMANQELYRSISTQQSMLSTLRPDTPQGHGLSFMGGGRRAASSTRPSTIKADDVAYKVKETNTAVTAVADISTRLLSDRTIGNEDYAQGYSEMRRVASAKKRLSTTEKRDLYTRQLGKLIGDIAHLRSNKGKLYVPTPGVPPPVKKPAVDSKAVVLNELTKLLASRPAPPPPPAPLPVDDSIQQNDLGNQREPSVDESFTVDVKPPTAESFVQHDAPDNRLHAHCKECGKGLGLYQDELSDSIVGYSDQDAHDRRVYCSDCYARKLKRQEREKDQILRELMDLRTRMAMDRQSESTTPASRDGGLGKKYSINPGFLSHSSFMDTPTAEADAPAPARRPLKLARIASANEDEGKGKGEEGPGGRGSQRGRGDGRGRGSSAPKRLAETGRTSSNLRGASGGRSIEPDDGPLRRRDGGIGRAPSSGRDAEGGRRSGQDRLGGRGAGDQSGGRARVDGGAGGDDDSGRDGNRNNLAPHTRGRERAETPLDHLVVKGRVERSDPHEEPSDSVRIRSTKASKEKKPAKAGQSAHEDRGAKEPISKLASGGRRAPTPQLKDDGPVSARGHMRTNTPSELHRARASSTNTPSGDTLNVVNRRADARAEPNGSDDRSSSRGTPHSEVEHEPRKRYRMTRDSRKIPQARDIEDLFVSHSTDEGIGWEAPTREAGTGLEMLFRSKKAKASQAQPGEDFSCFGSPEGPMALGDGPGRGGFIYKNPAGSNIDDFPSNRDRGLGLGFRNASTNEWIPYCGCGRPDCRVCTARQEHYNPITSEAAKKRFAQHPVDSAEYGAGPGRDNTHSSGQGVGPENIRKVRPERLAWPDRAPSGYKTADGNALRDRPSATRGEDRLFDDAAVGEHNLQSSHGTQTPLGASSSELRETHISITKNSSIVHHTNDAPGQQQSAAGTQSDYPKSTQTADDPGIVKPGLLDGQPQHHKTAGRTEQRPDSEDDQSRRRRRRSHRSHNTRHVHRTDITRNVTINEKYPYVVERVKCPCCNEVIETRLVSAVPDEYKGSARTVGLETRYDIIDEDNRHNHGRRTRKHTSRRTVRNQCTRDESSSPSSEDDEYRSRVPRGRSRRSAAAEDTEKMDIMRSYVALLERVANPPQAVSKSEAPAPVVYTAPHVHPVMPDPNKSQRLRLLQDLDDKLATVQTRAGFINIGASNISNPVGDSTQTTNGDVPMHANIDSNERVPAKRNPNCSKDFGIYDMLNMRPGAINVGFPM